MGNSGVDGRVEGLEKYDVLLRSIESRLPIKVGAVPKGMLGCGENLLVDG